MAYFSQQELSQFRNNAGAATQTKKTAKKPKQTGLKGFATSLLGEAGGTGGALGGAAAGAAVGSVVPGIGTAIGGLIGAGLGGFAGGTAGQVVENKVRDDEFNFGKAVKHGAVEGVLGAGPLRLAKAGAGALKGVKGAEGVLKGAEGAMSTPLLSKLPGAKKVGTAMSSSASGLKPGKEIGAQENVDELSQRLATMGIRGTPKQQGSQIKSKMSELGKEVDSVLTKTKQPLSGLEVSARLKQGIDDPIDDLFGEVDLLDPTVSKVVSRYMTRFEGLTDAKAINDQIKRVQPAAQRALSTIRKGGTPTAKDQAALAVKRAGDETLSKVAEIKPLKQQMATLFEANPDIISASQKGIGLPMTSGIQVKAPLQQGKGVASRLGANLQGAPQELTNRGILGRGAAAGIIGMENTPQEEIPLDETSMMPEMPIGGQAVATTAEDIMAEQDMGGGDGSIFSDPAQVQALYLQALQSGDTETANALLKGYEAFGASAGGTAGGKPLSAIAAKQQATANSGLDSINTLESIISQSGVPKGTVVAGRGLLGGLGQRALGTSSYDAAADNIADAIIRMRTGAAATKDEMRTFRSQLPMASDSPEVQRQKLNTVRQYLMAISNGTGVTTEGGDVSELMSMNGY